MKNPDYSDKDYDFISNVKLSVYRALWGEVIPSMRGIILKWIPEDKTVWICFYHMGEITDLIESHYSSIVAEVHGDYWDGPIICDHKIIRCDPPEKVPTHEDFIVYLRKEPFIDPNDAMH